MRDTWNLPEGVSDHMEAMEREGAAMSGCGCEFWKSVPTDPNGNPQLEMTVRLCKKHSETMPYPVLAKLVEGYQDARAAAMFPETEEW
jgi:hypothetical protein